MFLAIAVGIINNPVISNNPTILIEIAIIAAINIVNIAPGDFKTDIVKRRIDSFNDKNSLYFNKYYRLWKKMNDHVEKFKLDQLECMKLLHHQP